jgi:formiminotetrahydrofolate cyclodeaminase
LHLHQWGEISLLVNLSVSDYATSLASCESAPGGGSAAALSGLLGASLMEMVINLTIGRSEFDEHASLLVGKKAKLILLHDELKRLVDSDAAAFSAVVDAYKLPQYSKKEKQEQLRVIQETVTLAAEVPIEIARFSLEVMEIGKILLGKVNPHAVSDLVVGSLASHTSVVGALLNTAINLPLLKDKNKVRALKGQVHLLRNVADELIFAIQNHVYAEEPFAILKKDKPCG